jgi:predicted DNA-binding transcriptional regulator AlpA
MDSDGLPQDSPFSTLETEVEREPEVVKEVRLSPSTIRRLERAGDFPRRKRLSARVVASVDS